MICVAIPTMAVAPTTNCFPQLRPTRLRLMIPSIRLLRLDLILRLQTVASIMDVSQTDDERWQMPVQANFDVYKRRLPFRAQHEAKPRSVSATSGVSWISSNG
jgi:hypothetical protein